MMKRRPTHAEIPCQARHYWCREHEAEVCEHSRSLRVKHAGCKLTLLERAPNVREPEPEGIENG